MQVDCTLLWAACLAWGLLGNSSSQNRQQAAHDGSTVTEMLARMGLGPGADSTSAGACEEAGACLGGQGEDKPLPKDICWGYESGCTKEDRLFIPKCEGAAAPW